MVSFLFTALGTAGLCAVVVRSGDWVDELVADLNGLPEGASPKK
jgi:hypothetical protein